VRDHDALARHAAAVTDIPDLRVDEQTGSRAGSGDAAKVTADFGG
jgi:hypothetical protein